MPAAIKITRVGEKVSVDVDKGTGTFDLVLSEVPTEDWRKQFEKNELKDYWTVLKATERPARIEVTCPPSEVREAAEVVKRAIQKSNEKLDDQRRKAERKAEERSKAIAEIEESMLRELATVKFDAD